MRPGLDIVPQQIIQTPACIDTTHKPGQICSVRCLGLVAQLENVHPILRMLLHSPPLFLTQMPGLVYYSTTPSRLHNLRRSPVTGKRPGPSRIQIFGL